ncbi:MAG: hypothetical protein US49_C0001G0246 [candidate division TM6 bacterium GW2011_GWF2_37_49]|nr:MAG: hypothetical protein US49_C0001G0246 [candidate division TM6 bacterium GW2011_GWF2_37_49]
MKFNYMQGLLFLSVFFAGHFCLADLTPIPEQYVVDTKRATDGVYARLVVPDFILNKKLVTVFIKIKDKAYPEIDLKNPENFNFEYVKCIDNRVLPQGLFYWDFALSSAKVGTDVYDYYIGYLSKDHVGQLDKYAYFWDSSKNAYIDVVNKKPFKNENNLIHPSPSLWGLKPAAESKSGERVFQEGDLIKLIAALKSSLDGIKDSISKVIKNLGDLKKSFSCESPAPSQQSDENYIVKTDVWGESLFDQLMGMSEVDFKYKASEVVIKARISKDAQNCYWINGADDKLYRCGRFEVMTLGDLRRQAMAKADALKGTINQIRFSVIYSKSPKKCKQLDVTYLEAQPENKDAVFQVASNYNALESTTYTWLPDLNYYYLDNTQGPAASIAAFPGLVLRHFYFFMKDEKRNNNFMLWRQREQKTANIRDDNDFDMQLNLLDGLGVNTQNGYIWGTGEAGAGSGIENIKDENADKFKIGFHRDIQVTFVQSKNYYYTHFYQPSQTVNQVFAAAVNLTQAKDLCPEIKSMSDDKKHEIAQLILNWTYESTLKAAIVAGKKKVFLTLIGGGAFGNKREWIEEAIVQAVNDSVLKNSGLEIILNNWGSEPSAVLKALIKETGGEAIPYN